MYSGYLPLIWAIELPKWNSVCEVISDFAAVHQVNRHSVVPQPCYYFWNQRRIQLSLFSFSPRHSSSAMQQKGTLLFLHLSKSASIKILTWIGVSFAVAASSVPPGPTLPSIPKPASVYRRHQSADFIWVLVRSCIARLCSLKLKCMPR